MSHMMKIMGIHHASVTVRDLLVARAFYEGILELKPRDDRPGNPEEGVWYQAGDEQIHLIVVNDAELPARAFEGYPGRKRHIALMVRDLDALKTRLENAEIPVIHSRSGRPVMFCRDPDDNIFELVGV
jgi:glyoxylase I family protein